MASLFNSAFQAAQGLVSSLLTSSPEVPRARDATGSHTANSNSLAGQPGMPSGQREEMDTSMTSSAGAQHQERPFTSPGALSDSAAPQRPLHPRPERAMLSHTQLLASQLRATPDARTGYDKILGMSAADSASGVASRVSFTSLLAQQSNSRKRRLPAEDEADGAGEPQFGSSTGLLDSMQLQSGRAPIGRLDAWDVSAEPRRTRARLDTTHPATGAEEGSFSSSVLSLVEGPGTQVVSAFSAPGPTPSTGEEKGTQGSFWGMVPYAGPPEDLQGNGSGMGRYEEAARAGTKRGRVPSPEGTDMSIPLSGRGLSGYERGTGTLARRRSSLGLGQGGILGGMAGMYNLGLQSGISVPASYGPYGLLSGQEYDPMSSLLGHGLGMAQTVPTVPRISCRTVGTQTVWDRVLAPSHRIKIRRVTVDPETASLPMGEAQGVQGLGASSEGGRKSSMIASVAPTASGTVVPAGKVGNDAMPAPIRAPVVPTPIEEVKSTASPAAPPASGGVLAGFTFGEITAAGGAHAAVPASAQAVAPALPTEAPPATIVSVPKAASVGAFTFGAPAAAAPSAAVPAFNFGGFGAPIPRSESAPTTGARAGDGTTGIPKKQQVELGAGFGLSPAVGLNLLGAGGGGPSSVTHGTAPAFAAAAAPPAFSFGLVQPASEGAKAVSQEGVDALPRGPAAPSAGLPLPLSLPAFGLPAQASSSATAQVAGFGLGLGGGAAGGGGVKLGAPPSSSTGLPVLDLPAFGAQNNATSTTASVAPKQGASEMKTAAPPAFAGLSSGFPGGGFGNGVLPNLSAAAPVPPPTTQAQAPGAGSGSLAGFSFGAGQGAGSSAFSFGGASTQLNATVSSGGASGPGAFSFGAGPGGPAPVSAFSFGPGPAAGPGGSQGLGQPAAFTFGAPASAARDNGGIASFAGLGGANPTPTFGLPTGTTPVPAGAGGSVALPTFGGAGAAPAFAMGAKAKKRT